MSFGTPSTNSINPLSSATIAPSGAAPGPSPTQPPQDPFADPNGPFGNLDLTAAQQQQIQAIFGQNTSGSPLTPTQVFDQVNNILTPQQQQLLQNDLETLKSHHHHHHGGESNTASSSSNPLSQLNLTSAQQTQINQIIQSAQSSGASSSDVLSQIENVLTPAQQQQLTSLFASYTATGSAPAATPTSFAVNTNA